MTPWIDVILTAILCITFLGLCGLAGRYTHARDIKRYLGDTRTIRSRRASDK